MNAAEILAELRAIHVAIRDAVLAACETQDQEMLAGIAVDGPGDTIYAIDWISEERLVALVAERIATRVPILLIAEGLPDEGLPLPAGTARGDCRWHLIVDPIDGTRGLMYQKRPAWILSALAPRQGERVPRLSEAVAALQTEIPLLKQHRSDQCWWSAGSPVRAERHDRCTGTATPLALRPSRATTLAHGFGQISRFFPGTRELLAGVDDELARRSLGPVMPGKAQCFEDQYISTGGQLYELMCGHDRFCADLRPLCERVLAARGIPLGLCCHPYDLAGAPIARALGVLLTDGSGVELDCPLDLASDVAWIAYANPAIRAHLEAPLLAILSERDLGRVAEGPLVDRLRDASAGYAATPAEALGPERINQAVDELRDESL